MTVLNPNAGDWTGAIANAIMTATDQLIFLGRPERAIRQVDSVLAARPLDALPAANRPYLPLAGFFVMAGRSRHQSLRSGSRFGLPGLLADDDRH